MNVFIRKPSGSAPTSYSNTASATTFSVDPDPANNSIAGNVTLVKSSLAGRVYRDHDNDGTVDGGENGISGVQIALTGHDVFNNAVSRTATSDASGNYLIDNLEQADATGYTLTETQPTGYSDGLETAGGAATGSAPGGAVSAVIGSNTITGVKLDKDQAATGYLFGELRQNTLSGTVFADARQQWSEGRERARHPERHDLFDRHGRTRRGCHADNDHGCKRRVQLHLCSARHVSARRDSAHRLCGWHRHPRYTGRHARERSVQRDRAHRSGWHGLQLRRAACCDQRPSLARLQSGWGD